MNLEFEFAVFEPKKVDDVESYRRELPNGVLLARFRPALGELAPEISGADVFGEKFKLSDYRGKVVMLDFWGDW